MKHILLLLCLNCLGADTNYISNFSTNEDFVIQSRQPQIVQIYSIKSPNPWFTAKLIKPLLVTNEILGSKFTDYDYSCTNMEIISTVRPIVTETNGQWIITFIK